MTNECVYMSVNRSLSFHYVKKVRVSIEIEVNSDDRPSYILIHVQLQMKQIIQTLLEITEMFHQFSE
jgi:hypothetical protein